MRQFKAKPLTIREANAFVQLHHRHSLPTVGCKFAIGALDCEQLVGVAIAGRPVARHADDGLTLEVLRVCTDGTPNACSFLYSRVKTLGSIMGYKKIITYTLESESGASLKAVRAKQIGIAEAQEWSKPSRPRKSQHVYSKNKIKWEL